MSRQKKKPAVKVTWAQAFRDIVTTAMNRGQLLLISVVMMVFLMIWKMPPADVSTLVFDIWGSIKSGATLGWILWLGTLAGSFYLGKKLRKLHSQECHRVGTEKSKLQKKELDRLEQDKRQRSKK